MEFLLEMLFICLPFKELKYLSAARKMLLDCLEFLVFVIDLRVDVNSTRYV
jgi:hypothetical protein